MRRLFAVLALSLARTALGADGELALGTGLHYTTGTYGTSTTTRILALPLTARYDREAWTFKAYVPYLEIDGDSNVIPGLGPVNGNGRGRRPAGQATRASGLGDSTLSATYNVYGRQSGIGLTGKVKLATGDEHEGLGTGGNDVSFAVDAFQQLARYTIFGVLGYTIFGDSPFGQLDNVANLGLGASLRVNSADSVGASLDLRQAGSPLPLEQRELTGFWTHRIDRAWRAQAYLLKGFADGSPDWGAGVSAAYTF
ncbi:MAG TPA: transporter [Burkholderiales bacterium]|nr:transporter [Burkholderiales bacterium]